MSSEQARALVASILNGDLDLAEHTMQLHTLRLSATHLPLRRGPATSVEAVHVDGAALDPEAYSLTPFALVREDGHLWPAAATIRITYSSGWQEGNEPLEIQEALILAEQWFDTNPGAGITSVRIGNESVTRATSEDGTGPAAIEALIRRWITR